jgi:hypothetical protein
MDFCPMIKGQEQLKIISWSEQNPSKEACSFIPLGKNIIQCVVDTGVDYQICTNSE